VSAVASALAGSDVPLGVLPLGTLNHFARDLGISLDLEQAVRDIAGGVLRKVDAGEVNGRVFINNSSLGLYPYMVLDREKQRRRLRRGKWHAMFWASMAVLKRYPFLDVRLTLNGLMTARRTPLVFIGNDSYAMDGVNIGTRERLDEGILSLHMVRPVGRLGLVRLALRAILGRLHEAEDFEMHKVDAVRIEPRKRRGHQLVAIDGEIALMQMPLQYRVRPAALTVIVPAAVSVSAGGIPSAAANAAAPAPARASA
jgi:diacylglycerol kinase family enzyme